MKLTRLLLITVSAVMISAASSSADTINTIDQVEKAALLNNLDYRTAVLDVLKAQNAIESYIKIENSALGLSGAYEGPSENESSSSETSSSDPLIRWQASASLPLIEQLGITAALDQDLKGTITVSINPFSHSAAVQQSKLAYDQKLAAAENIAQATADNAVSTYLGWAAASADYKINAAFAEVNKTLYEDEKVRYDKGESNLDDVRQAFSAWSDSRTSMNSALTALQAAETDLYSILNINPAEYTLELPGTEDILDAIDKLQENTKISALSITESYSVLAAETAADDIRLQLDSIWLFEPDFNLSGSMSVSADSSVPQFSATASLSIGLDDWKSDEREELQTELEISRQNIVQTVRAENLNLQQAITNADTAAINLEVARIELEQAEELLDEAEFLHEIGEYSEAELEETALQYEQSKNNLFSAAADHYTALRALAAYID